jgi:uncharacterized membrane protein YeaQ/YmgE (transglycosylase-associated protein family)
MDITRLLVQVGLAIACALIANVLVPRRIPGKFAGLVLIGLGGVVLGEWAFNLIRQRFGFDLPVLGWHVQNVPILPAIIGSMIILYVVTAFLKWAKYSS